MKKKKRNITDGGRGKREERKIKRCKERMMEKLLCIYTVRDSWELFGSGAKSLMIKEEMRR